MPAAKLKTQNTGQKNKLKIILSFPNVTSYENTGSLWISLLKRKFFCLEIMSEESEVRDQKVKSNDKSLYSIKSKVIQMNRITAGIWRENS